MTAGGCVCAYFAASTCEFFAYEVPDDGDASSGLIPPFTDQSEGFVGLFGAYAVVNDPSTTCESYPHVWIDAIRNNDDVSVYLVVAQFAAIVGPSLGAAAFLLNLVEWFLWAPNCSYVLSLVLLVGAFCIQGCTFLIYAVDGFW